MTDDVIEQRARILLVFSSRSVVTVSDRGIDMYGETRFLGVRIRGGYLVRLTWTDVKDVIHSDDEPLVARVIPVKLGRFLQPVKEGAIRIHLRVDENGYLVLRWKDRQLTLRFVDACRARHALMETSDASSLQRSAN